MSTNEPNLNFFTYFLCFSTVIISVIIVAAIIAAIFLVKKSNLETERSEKNINKIIVEVPEEKQMLFMMQYNNVKKKPTTAVLLALFLGVFGAHKFYMEKVGIGILYLVFSWTFIPTIISFIEAFTISSVVAKYNEEKALDILSMVKGNILLSHL